MAVGQSRYRLSYRWKKFWESGSIMKRALMVLVHGRALGCERKQLQMILGFQCEPLPERTDLLLTAVMKLFEGNGSRALCGLE